MSLILWRVMQEGPRRGIYFLDLGKTRVGSGVFEFKRKWGGVMRQINTYTLGEGSGSRSPFLDPANPRLRWATTLWRKLVPLQLTRGVGYLLRRFLGK